MFSATFLGQEKQDEKKKTEKTAEKKDVKAEDKKEDMNKRIIRIKELLLNH